MVKLMGIKKIIKLISKCLIIEKLLTALIKFFSVL